MSSYSIANGFEQLRSLFKLRILIVSPIWVIITFSIALPGFGADNVNPEKIFVGIHKAVVAKDINSIEQIIKTPGFIDAKDEHGNTPLMVAAQRGYFDIVKLLVERGADINATNKLDNNVLIFLTTYSEYREMLMLGGTQAVVVGVTLDDHPKIASYLIDKGVNVNYEKNGFSTLIVAACYEKTQLAQLYLKRGANPNAKTTDGATALMVAAFQGNKDFVELLLSNGAEVNLVDSLGRTALDVATSQDIKNLLLAHGAKEGKEIK